MPAGDRTGPMGMGPMTGRRMGYCADNYRSGYYYGLGFGRNRGFGLGRGFGFSHGAGRDFGFGRGFGWHSMDYPDRVTDEDRRTVLANDIKAMKEELAFMEKELSKYDNES